MSMRKITLFVALFTISTTTLLSGQVMAMQCSDNHEACCCDVKPKAPSCHKTEPVDCGCLKETEDNPVTEAILPNSFKDLSVVKITVSKLNLSPNSKVGHRFIPQESLKSYLSLSHSPPGLRAPPQFLPLTA